MISESQTPSLSLPDDISRALHLVHSIEPDSATELRAMLDASIAARYGTERTIHARYPDLCHEKLYLEEENSLFDEDLRTGLFTDSGGNDVGGKDEVPRISIPDEQNNEAVCKVCNVSEFGPLILIQCRICDELYHPLCHQPPVVDARDVDVTWSCSECERNMYLECTSTNALVDDSKWIRGDEIKKYSKKSYKNRKHRSSDKEIN